MIPVKLINPDDLPLYAMQLLPSEEMEQIRLHLQHSPETRLVLSDILSDLSLVAHSADMHAPEPQVRDRFLKQIASEKKAVPIDLADGNTPRVAVVAKPEPIRRSTAATVLPWVGWAIAAGLALEAGNLYQQRQHLYQEREHLQETVASERMQHDEQQRAAQAAELAVETVRDPTAVHVSLTGTGVKPPPEGRASYVQNKGSLVFIASNLEPLDPAKTYELWLIPADGRDPIPAGTFRPDTRGNASLVLPELPKGVQAKAFGVTVEEGAGSQKPTMPIILQGLAS